jgi:uncharacterized protein YbjT (DUF2867 family)
MKPDLERRTTSLLISNNQQQQQQYMGKAYTITGQEAISYGKAAEILSNEIGKRISYVDISQEHARNGMK